MNNRLISLKERPATKKDKGKTFYWIYTSKTWVDIKECKIEDVDDKFVYIKGKFKAPIDAPVLYRNKPILVSQEEYDELSKSKDRVVELEATVKACQETHDRVVASNNSAVDRIEELEAENKELKEYINGVEFNLEKSDSINDNLEQQVKELQQRLDKAVEIIKSYQKCNDIGDGYGCCNLIQAECIDKFLEANPLNTSQVESKENIK